MKTLLPERKELRGLTLLKDGRWRRDHDEKNASLIFECALKGGQWYRMRFSIHPLQITAWLPDYGEGFLEKHLRPLAMNEKTEQVDMLIHPDRDTERFELRFLDPSKHYFTLGPVSITPSGKTTAWVHALRSFRKKEELSVLQVAKRLAGDFNGTMQQAFLLHALADDPVDGTASAQHRAFQLTMQSYGSWARKRRPDAQELEDQRRESDGWNDRPVISVVVPTYHTDHGMLRDMVQSVLDQSYTAWELCIADGASGDPRMEKLFASLPNTKYVMLDENRGIAGNSNAALSLATGDYVALLDHDDRLAPDALYELASAIRKTKADVLYSDEDKFEKSLDNCFEPNFKPDFDPEYLRHNNYICHLFAAKRELFERIGGWREGFDGAQDHDLIFRLTEQTDSVVHIPKVLYHWRSHAASTASAGEAKPYVQAAGVRAVEEHLQRIGLPGKVEGGFATGFYNVDYALDAKPLVSILIPNMDHSETLDKCLCSIDEKTTYENYEVIVIENNSREKKTFDYYEQIPVRFAKMRVVIWEGEGGFNYSALNNFGEKHAKGDHLLLLNNDTAVITPDWIEKMLSLCQRESTGAVGCRLLYPDETVQHGGVILGLHGVAGHAFCGAERTDPGYVGKLRTVYRVSAVTAACMMVRRDAFEKVGGLSEEYAVAFNDVDFCMKLGRAGYAIYFTPEAELWHFESRSRGSEDTPEKKARFKSEVLRFQRTWREELEKGDPWYNPNLTRNYGTYLLRGGEESAYRRYDDGED